MGADSDLQIYYNSSNGNSYIHETGGGDLLLQGVDVKLRSSDDGANMLHGVENGSVTIYHNGSAKMSTTSTGINVTGKATLTSGELTFSGSISDPNGAAYIWRPADNTLAFGTANEERMRIDSSGNLLVSKTASDGGVQGHEFRTNNFAIHTVDNGPALYAKRIGTSTNDNGDVQVFQNADGTFGVIGNRAGYLSIGSGDVGIEFHSNDNAIYPMNMSNYTLNDNAIALGSGDYRFDDAFITNGVTTGSDRNDKQDIAALTSTEMLVAARISKTFHTYRWKDAVVDKGDDARIHTGTIAQELQAAFTAEGLDAGRYAMFMLDTWWGHDVEVPAVEADDTADPAIEAKDAYTRNDHYKTEDEAPSGSTKKTRLGIRYPELLSFLAAYNEQRFAAIETRLAALEGN